MTSPKREDNRTIYAENETKTTEDVAKNAG
jgi:hypothetical protein